ncbi:MAG: hypothetical protein ABIO92_04680 [Chloroflexia bacterium]
MEELRTKYDRQERIIVKLFHALIIVLSLTMLFFILVPFYGSGFNRMSVVDIEWINLWLREANLYPPLPGNGDVWAIAAFSGWFCVGFPLLAGLWAELLLGLQYLSVRARMWRLTVLIPSTLLLIVLKLSSDQISALLFD